MYAKRIKPYILFPALLAILGVIYMAYMWEGQRHAKSAYANSYIGSLVEVDKKATEEVRVISVNRYRECFDRTFLEEKFNWEPGEMRPSEETARSIAVLKCYGGPRPEFYKFSLMKAALNAFLFIGFPVGALFLILWNYRREE